MHRVGGDGVDGVLRAPAGPRPSLTVREAAGSVVVMAAGTDRGNEVMAHVAARAGVPMAANVLSFSGLSPFVVTRQVVGGAALEEMDLHQRPAVFTVAGHAVEAAAGRRAGRGRPGRARARGRRGGPGRPGGLDRASREADLSGALTSARVVVGAGRGAGGADRFDDVLELAELLGGTLGVSRVVTSAGWRPHHEQVGQTGSRISPELYIPCGISGAIQHWAGCALGQEHPGHQHRRRGADGDQGDYAVIGDLHEIVPAINAEIRRRGYGG